VAHAPAVQIEPPAQTVQLAPQCAESLDELQAPSEHIAEPAGHNELHEPLLQVWPEPHTLPQLPQFTAFEATHEPPQEMSPLAQKHCPAWQVLPPPQSVQLAPQWLESVLPLHTPSAHSAAPGGHQMPPAPADPVTPPAPAAPEVPPPPPVQV